MWLYSKDNVTTAGHLWVRLGIKLKKQIGVCCIAEKWSWGCGMMFGWSLGCSIISQQYIIKILYQCVPCVYHVCTLYVVQVCLLAKMKQFMSVIAWQPLKMTSLQNNGIYLVEMVILEMYIVDIRTQGCGMKRQCTIGYLDHAF